MRVGVRAPSVSKRISARTSPKRYARQTLGLKAPRGMGVITDPKRAMYNRVYSRTTISADQLLKAGNVEAQKLGAKTSKISLAKPQARFMYQRASSFAIWRNKKSRNAHKRALALVAESVRFFNSDDYESALDLAWQAYDEDPDYVCSSYLIGACSNNLGDPKTAAEYLQKYNDRVFDDQHAQYVMGLAYLHIGEFDHAKEIAKRLLLSLGYQLEVVRLFGLSQFERGDFENAAEVFKRAPLRKQIDSEVLLDIHYWPGRVPVHYIPEIFINFVNPLRVLALTDLFRTATQGVSAH